MALTIYSLLLQYPASALEFWLLVFRDFVSVGLLASGLYVYYGTRKAERRLQKASFVRTYTIQFFETPEIARMFFSIDFEHFHYSDRIWHTKAELPLISLLDLLNSLGFSRKQGLIDLEDIDATTLGYAVVRTFQDKGVQAYLARIDEEDKRRGYPGQEKKAFGYFRELAEELK